MIGEVLESELAKDLSGGFIVGPSGFFGGSKVPNVHLLPVNTDLRSPATISRYPDNATVA